MEHAGPVVPVGEHALVRPAVPHDVPQAERLQFGQGRPFRRGDMGLPHVGVRVEDVGVRRRDVHVATDHYGPGTGPDRLAQRRQPGELVVVMTGVRRPPVRHVHRVHPDPAAAGGHGPRLGVGKSRRTRDSRHHAVQPDAGKDRHPVPPGFTVHGRRVAAAVELGAEKFGERVVAELGFLEADHIGLSLVQPGQQARHPLLDRVHVPGRYPHRAYSSRAIFSKDSGPFYEQRPAHG